MTTGHPVHGLILAGGLGTRMKSSRAKVLHELQGKPMILHVMDTVAELNLDRTFVIVGHQKEQVEELLQGYQAECIVQEKQLGTGHAVLCAENKLRDAGGTVLILNGDVPLVRPETLQVMLAEHAHGECSLTLMTTLLEKPTGYGRIKRDSRGNITGIVEEKDASLDEKKIREINAGIYCAEVDFLFKALGDVGTDNRQQEMYLTDIVSISINMGKRVNIFSGAEPEEVLGINSKDELAAAEKYLSLRRKNLKRCL